LVLDSSTPKIVVQNDIIKIVSQFLLLVAGWRLLVFVCFRCLSMFFSSNFQP